MPASMLVQSTCDTAPPGRCQCDALIKLFVPRSTGHGSVTRLVKFQLQTLILTRVVSFLIKAPLMKGDISQATNSHAIYALQMIICVQNLPIIKVLAADRISSAAKIV